MATHWLHRPDRRAHQEALADGLRAGCAAFAVLFTVFAVWHAFDFGPEVARVMVPLALATGAAGRRRVRPGEPAPPAQRPGEPAGRRGWPRQRW
jgi:hypothetical protein